MLETRRLTKEYQPGVRALSELDLVVREGEVCCLLGANGAGKTTTINLLLDFIKPSSGSALIDGIVVDRDPLTAKRNLAFLPENVQLYGNLTGRQNLRFFTQLYEQALSDKRLDEILAAVGLPNQAFDQRVREYSKGMRQKLGLAIVKAKEAPNLLLDEPLAGLDPEAAASLVETLGRLRDQGKAILMSTHDVFRAKELADRVVILFQGRKIMEQTRAELGNTNLETLYLDYIRGRRAPDAAPLSPAAG